MLLQNFRLNFVTYRHSGPGYFVPSLRPWTQWYRLQQSAVANSGPKDDSVQHLSENGFQLSYCLLKVLKKISGRLFPRASDPHRCGLTRFPTHIQYLTVNLTVNNKAMIKFHNALCSWGNYTPEFTAKFGCQTRICSAEFLQLKAELFLDRHTPMASFARSTSQCLRSASRRTPRVLTIPRPSQSACYSLLTRAAAAKSAQHSPSQVSAPNVADE